MKNIQNSNRRISWMGKMKSIAGAGIGSKPRQVSPHILHVFWVDLLKGNLCGKLTVLTTFLLQTNLLQFVKSL